MFLNLPLDIQLAVNRKADSVNQTQEEWIADLVIEAVSE